ncbi:CLUMA_CG013573, isoform A [Clunio marinus]|uniref:CLUMA_CG013573, isoform A n=1 Tax=Clunio marinus TaxID=568069 RepID=A0A1J1IL66_9DIPT|nr:CLUMA_CG013573, isoform A [Clunio marinus]
MKILKADRDIFDWSGKKPLDYQKQLTSISASTFSSEYNIVNNVSTSNNDTMSKRQTTMKKNRNRGVQRSLTVMNSGSGSLRGSFDDLQSNDNFDTRSVTSHSGVIGFGGASMKRKNKKYRSKLQAMREAQVIGDSISLIGWSTWRQVYDV